MSDLRLIIFDVDGTLVDSQADIVAAMHSAHAAVGVAMPDPAKIRSIIGLSLPQAFAELHPQLPPDTATALVEGYKATFRSGADAAPSPLFAGMERLLQDLAADPFTLLGVATGKSRRGLDRVIKQHNLHGLFHTLQVADHHPSKPHPSMILTAIAECGVDPAQTCMIGDTSFDMDMARAAGVLGIGVGWGYHPPARMGADVFVATADDLKTVLTKGPTS